MSTVYITLHVCKNIYTNNILRMSLKKDVFRCTVVYDHEQKESAPIEIDAKRVNNTVTLSLVITNQTPEKGSIS